MMTVGHMAVTKGDESMIVDGSLGGILVLIILILLVVFLARRV